MRIQEILDYYAEELYRGEQSRATYALRNTEREFLVLMEASRDITEARSLQGEKRL